MKQRNMSRQTAEHLLLPLRLTAMQTAFPLLYLKSPHLSVFSVIRHAFRSTRRRSRHLIVRRICRLPLLLCPLTTFTAFPALIIAELCETAAKSDKNGYLTAP